MFVPEPTGLQSPMISPFASKYMYTVPSIYASLSVAEVSLSPALWVITS